MELEKSMVGRGRECIEWITDEGSFTENKIGPFTVEEDLGPGAVVGTARLDGTEVTVLANDAQAINPRFPVVYFGVIGMEEALKMAMAVYMTIEADEGKTASEKRPLVLIVDTPGNGPGKVEELIGMNKATGAYQLALAEAREKGHPVIAMVIGRAISGAFLCHGLQADKILALPKDYGTMIHVMPLSSISRITKIDIHRLEKLAEENPVFAAGAEFFYRLGGVDEMVEEPSKMRAAVSSQIQAVRELKGRGEYGLTGPMGRGILGEQRGGRLARPQVLAKMEEEFAQVEAEYLELV